MRDRTVSVRPVTLGVVDGERVAIAKGLNAGEVVVTEGGDRLRDGAQVQLPGAAPPAAGAPPPGKTQRGKGRSGDVQPGTPGAAASPGSQHSRAHPKPSQ